MSEPVAADYSAEVIRDPRLVGEKRPEEVGPLKGSGGGDRFDGMSWQEAVRRVDEKVDGNFRWTIGVFGGGFMTLLAAFAAGFLILSAKIEGSQDKLTAKLDTISAQIADVKTDVAVLKAAPQPLQRH